MGDMILEKIIEAATQDFRKRLEEAFFAGGEKVRADLLAVLAPSGVRDDISPRGPTYEEVVAERHGVRAAPGTVKPTILEMIAGASQIGLGVSTPEIIAKTGFKENSVRGTLSTLRSEGKIESRDDRWFRKEPSSPSALEEDEIV